MVKIKNGKRFKYFLIAVYFIFVFLDIFYPSFYNDCIKYFFVVSIAFYALIYGDILLFLAELFILPADYCLLFTYRYELGVAFFCAAIYIFILRNGKKLCFSILPFTFLLIYAINKTGAPSVYLIYACLFYYHIFILYILKKTDIFISFVPFALCDIIVAANYLNPMPLIRPFIWILYGLSQILIVTGGIKKKQYKLSYRFH